MRHRLPRALPTAILAALLLPAILAGQSGVAPKEATRARATPVTGNKKADPEKARRAYESGQQAEQAELWSTAFALYSEALSYAPENLEYEARRERAKFRVVQEQVDQAEMKAVLGQLEEARTELRSALTIDPTYRVAQERLEQLQPRGAKEFNGVGEYEAGITRLRPKPGKQSFDYRGNTQGAFEELAGKFGLTVALDQDVGSKQIRFRVANVDFFTAVGLLQQQTSTFIRVLDEKAYLVIPDTTDKRKQYAVRITRTLLLPASTTPEQMTEIRQVARDIAGITNPQIDTRTRQLVLRGEPQAVLLAMELVHELEQAPGEILLDVQFVEVDRSKAEQLGIVPPTSGRVVTLSPADVREAQQSPEALLRVIQRVFGSTTSFGGLTPQELATRLASGQVGVASLLPPLIAFGGGKTLFLSSLPGATADFADTLSVVRRARRLLLRAEDGQPATFFVGDRFPISYAVLTPSIGAEQIVPGIQRTDFSTGNGPSALAAGDFDGDGKLDLASANSATDTVSVLLNAGSGSFGAKTDFQVGNKPRAIVSRDFNGDNKLDLGVANSADNTISILFGTGTGSFNPGVTLASGTTPVALAGDDFNADGRPDLAVVNSADNTVSLYLGGVGGAFNLSQLVATGQSPGAIAIADFNGDGKPDLVITNSGDDTVSIFFGAGNGLFNTGGTLPTGNNPVGVATGDFNGDGKQDFAVANKGGNSVSVILGNGDGTFSAKKDFATGTLPVALAVADFTGDSRLDIAVADSGENRITLLSGLGDGTFTATDFAASGLPFAVLAGDFNGDGRADLVAANREANNVTAFLNTTAVVPTTQAAQVPYPAFQYEDLGVKVRATPRLHANGEVTLQLQIEIRSLSGDQFNSIPVISNRTIEQTVRLRGDEPTLLSGILQQQADQATTGWPGLSMTPGIGRTAAKKQRERRETELVIAITPRRVRLADRKDRLIYAGRKDEASTPPTPERQPPE